jgi:hypothetical protein
MSVIDSPIGALLAHAGVMKTSQMVLDSDKRMLNRLKISIDTPKMAADILARQMSPGDETFRDEMINNAHWVSPQVSLTGLPKLWGEAGFVTTDIYNYRGALGAHLFQIGVNLGRVAIQDHAPKIIEGAKKIAKKATIFSEK